MHQLGFVLFTYVATVLHVGVGSQPLSGVGVQPHFLLLVVITAVIYFDHWSALIWAAVAGLLSDCLSTGPLGIEMASFTAAGFLMQHQLRRHRFPSAIRVTLLTFAITLATLTLSNTLRLVITGRQFDHARLVLLIGTTALVTAFLVGSFRFAQSLCRLALLRRSNSAASSY